MNLPDISAKYFDTIVQKYYAELRTEKGGEYELDSLHTMLGAMHIYSRRHRKVPVPFTYRYRKTVGSVQ